MAHIRLEITQAARRLLGTPGFTVAAVLTLALAIAANASMFAVVHRVVLNPLPYPDSGSLIVLEHSGTLGPVGMTPGLYYHYRDRARTLDGVAIHDQFETTVTGAGVPERVEAARVTASLGAVLGVTPVYGRWFREAELRADAPRLVVLSHGFWTRRYGGDPRVVGMSVSLEGVPAEIVGVMPAGFAYPSPDVQIWVGDPVTSGTEFGFISYQGVARLRAGASIADARAELTRLIPEVAARYSESPLAGNLAGRIKLVSSALSLKSATVGAVERALWILLASVGLVLVVAGANVTNLFMVRSEARQREIAVRRALGADRAALVRYFLSESGLLSLGAATLGLGLAWVTLRLLVALEPANLPRLHEIRIDGIVVAFTAALGAASAILFAAIPLLRRMPTVLSGNAQRATAGRISYRTRLVLVGGQIALALVLLASSALMGRSFQKLRAIDPGFDTADTVTFRIGLPRSAYPSGDAVTAAHEAIIARLQALPGVTAVSASHCLPLENIRCVGNSLTLPQDPAGETMRPNVWLHGVAGGFVEALGLRLVRGRGIDADDVRRRDRVVVVNQALADAYFPGADPIGRQVLTRPRGPAATIVGVVGNTPTRALVEPARALKLYLPLSVIGPGDGLLGPDPGLMSYIVRTSVDPRQIMADLHRAVHTLDPDLALAQPRTLADIVDKASAYMAFTMVLLAIAALVALTLGLVGTYAVVAYVVSQRRREIGVRLALGAEPARVVAMVVRQGGIAAVAGVIAGLAATIAGGRLLESLLYDVSARDAGVLGVTTMTLVAIALAACWLPARRAAHIDPALALRAD